jgi:hypothetical protein
VRGGNWEYQVYGQVWNSNSSRTRFGFGVNPKIPYFGSYLYNTSQAGTGVRLGLAVHAGVLDYSAQDKITTMSNALLSFFDLLEIRCSRLIFLEIRAGCLFQFFVQILICSNSKLFTFEFCPHFEFFFIF